MDQSGANLPFDTGMPSSSLLVRTDGAVWGCLRVLKTIIQSSRIRQYDQTVLPGPFDHLQQGESVQARFVKTRASLGASHISTLEVRPDVPASGRFHRLRAKDLEIGKTRNLFRPFACFQKRNTMHPGSKGDLRSFLEAFDCVPDCRLLVWERVIPFRSI
jgi:hypothetical protein